MTVAATARAWQTGWSKPHARGETRTPISPRAIHYLKLFSDWLCLNAAQPLALRIVHVDESQ